MSGAPPLPPGGGVLPLDKPEGPTSHDVVAKARRSLGERRVGHTGTLDPFASGLLLLCVGPATRLAEYLSSLDKEYVAVLRLGQRTTTHDPEGGMVAESDAWRRLVRADLENALGRFVGTLLQQPPEFSAKKVGGVPAYRKARRGEVVELPPASVTIHDLEVEAWEPPLARLRVACSSGTYVRALARDLGDALGVGAHLTGLRRTRVGPFRVQDAAPAEALDDRARLLAHLIDPAAALAHLPSVSLGEDAARRLAHGQEVDAPDRDLPEGRPLAVLRGGSLVAVATSVGGRLRPRKVFAGWEP